MKKLIMCIMSFMLIFSCCEPAFVVEAKSMNQLQKDKNKYEQNKKNAKAALEQAKIKQKNITDEISKLDKSVMEAEEELEKITNKLEETQKKLEAAQKELQVATEKKEKQLNDFKKRIKYIHEHGSIGYLEVVLQSESFNDFLTRMQYVNDIMTHDKTTLEELKKNEKIIQTKTEEIKVERDNITVLAEQQKQKNQELQQKLVDKKNVAEQYRKDTAKYEQELASWTKASNEVENLIYQASRSTGANGGGAQGNVKYTGGQFAWPVPGRSNISSGYGYRSRPIGSGREFHTGYDIPGSYGTNIVAAAGGRVITARYVNGYGYTVMIDHGSGLVTLYGHNSKLMVSQGQTVSRGQVIAKCGSTGNSTGNHCHFEVRKNGKHTSPGPYLGV